MKKLALKRRVNQGNGIDFSAIKITYNAFDGQFFGHNSVLLLIEIGQVWIHLCRQLLATRDPLDRNAERFRVIIDSTIKSMSSSKSLLREVELQNILHVISRYQILVIRFQCEGVQGLRSGMSGLIDTIQKDNKSTALDSIAQSARRKRNHLVNSRTSKLETFRQS